MNTLRTCAGNLLRAGAATALAALAACEPPPPPQRPRPAASAAPVIKEETKVAPTAIYVYTPIGKRDPFQNLYQMKELTPLTPVNHPKTPLEKWSIDQLRLAMTVTGTSTPFAVVEDPNGRGWTIRDGDWVGQHAGKVTAIQRDQVVITETITDHATGRVYPSNILLKVPKDESEKRAQELLKEGEEIQAAANERNQ